MYCGDGKRTVTLVLFGIYFTEKQLLGLRVHNYAKQFKIWNNEVWYFEFGSFVHCNVNHGQGDVMDRQLPDMSKIKIVDYHPNRKS